MHFSELTEADYAKAGLNFFLLLRAMKSHGFGLKKFFIIGKYNCLFEVPLNQLAIAANIPTRNRYANLNSFLIVLIVYEVNNKLMKRNKMGLSSLALSGVLFGWSLVK